MTSPRAGIAGGTGDRLTLWDVATGSVRRTITTRHADCNILTLTPYGTTLVVGSSDGTIQFWRVK